MGVWEYESEDFVNILYHMNTFSIYILRYFCPVTPFLGKKKQPRCRDRFYNIITEFKFIPLFFLF